MWDSFKGEGGEGPWGVSMSIEASNKATGPRAVLRLMV